MGIRRSCLVKVGIFLGHKILALALKKYLSSLASGIHEVIEDEDSSQGLDVIVTDYPTLVSGKLSSLSPEAKVLLLDTGLSMVKRRIALLFFKVRGILQPEASPKLFLKALERIYRGDLWLDHATTEELLSFSRDGHLTSDIRGLTKREREIIPLVCKGYKNKEIAATLGISVPTVKALLSKVFRKFSVSSRSQLQAAVMGSDILDRL